MARATKEHRAAVDAAKAYLRAIAAAVGGVVDANDRVHVGEQRIAARVGATVDVEGARWTFRPWADPALDAIGAAKAALRSHAA